MRLFHPSNLKGKPWGCLVAAVLLCTALGCGDDDPEINSRLNNGGGTNNDNSDADVGAADAGDTGDAGGEPVGQSCVAPPEELGTFSDGDAEELVRGFHERSHPNRATCQEAAPRAGVYWFAFEVDEPLIARFEVESTAASDPLIELRQDECASAEDVLFCTDALTQTQVVVPGETYYLLVQGAEDSSTGDFRLDLSFEQAACDPSETVCQDGVVQVCPDGRELLSRACGGECLDDSSCAGDTCSAPIEVDLSTAGDTQLISGNRQAYTSEWDVSGLSGCSLEEGQTASPTPGAELFLQLTGHSQGDTIVFETEPGTVDFGFYLLSSCGSSSCMDAGAYDELGDNRFEWQANVVEEVYVAAEAIGRDRDRDFQIEITRQP